MTPLDRAIEALPAAYPGPGGAVAILRRGEVLVRHAWGWANAEERIPFTPTTPFRICSITKQFTCATALALHPNLSVLDADVRARMPRLDAPPGALHLAHNQSGLRDYWATAMLCGAPVERTFDETDARHLIGLTRTTHFTPGTRYSYCNQNFRILGDIVEARAGRPLDALMREHLFDPAGMATARLVPDTAAVQEGTLGYEGSVASGFRPAVNRITWTGDAGLVASLDDMIAWERFIDTTREDPASPYTRLSTPVPFADGTPALYGFGLSRQPIAGHAATGHGGGLRGWTSFRCNLPGERISAVLLLNHMNDTRTAVADVLKALLGPEPEPPREPFDPTLAGTYLEPEAGLLARLIPEPDGRLALWYAGFRPEILDANDPTAPTRLRHDGDALWLDRDQDHQSTRLERYEANPRPPPEGRFHCPELDATMTCIDSYAAFSGFLGQGAMHPMLPAGSDLWRYPCPRALDHAPPGDWTLRVRRDEADAIAAIEVGCWLARHLVFARQG